MQLLKTTLWVSVLRCGNNSCHFLFIEQTPANHLHIVSKNLGKGSWIPEASTERKCPQSSGSPSLSLPGAAAAVVCSAALGEKETSVCHVPVQWRGWAVGHQRRFSLYFFQFEHLGPPNKFTKGKKYLSRKDFLCKFVIFYCVCN